MIRQEINVKLKQLSAGEFAEITTGRGNKQPNYNKLEATKTKRVLHSCQCGTPSPLWEKHRKSSLP
jgi:hypothetical protein